MQIITYFRPYEPFNLSAYVLLRRPDYRRRGHSTLYAISKVPMNVPRLDGNPQHRRSDGKHERLLALRNGRAIEAYIQRQQDMGKTECFIHRALDSVERRLQ